MLYRLIFLFTLVLPGVSGAPESNTADKAWDREGASKAWAHAQELKRDILGKPSAPLPEYLECVRWFQLVYKLDPHFVQSDDAVFEAAAIYHRIGESFGGAEHLKRAAQLFKFLSEDYPTSKWAPEALLLLGDLNAGPLDSPKAAEAAYARLTARYRASNAASRYLGRSRSASQSVPAQPPGLSIPQPERPQPPKSGSGQLPSPPMQPVTLNRVEHLTGRDHTKVTIETSGQAAYSIQRLKEPERVFFDLENVVLPKSLLNSSVSVQDPRLKQLRMGQNQPTTARVVLDLEEKADYSVTEMRDPFRIVIIVTTLGGETAVARGGPPQGTNVEPRTPGAAESRAPIHVSPDRNRPGTVPSHAPPGPSAGSASHPVAGSASSAKGSPAKTSKPATDIVRSARADSEVPERDARPVSRTPEPVPQPKMSVPTSLGNRTVTRSLGLKVGRIVIDPGHGGHDMGTVGPGGLVEKDLVLRLALDLKALLEERLGAEVILTREDDSFVSLEDRTAIANANQADLFVSLHANYSESRSTSGVETYFLDFARTKEEREVAARENAATMRTVGDLQSLVGRIARGEKMEESRELASVIQRSLFGTARQLMSASKDRGVRSAPFIVLIGAEMPSILVEVAFLSNPADERAMRLDSNRQKVAEALLSGVATYMKTLGSETAQHSTAPIR